MLKKKIHLLSLILVSCAAPSSGLGQSQIGRDEIKYISTDLAHAVFFSIRAARLGPNDLTISPPMPLRYLRNGNVRCISVGPVGKSIEYAVERPLKAGAHYHCGETSFTVTQCFDNCRAAVILRETSLHGNSEGSFLRSYMYVDSCVGVLVLNSSRDPSSGIPLDAELLRGPVGILAGDDYPKCV